MTRGYTLIELLVVISIISILSVAGFVNIKNFSASQIVPKAIGEIQSLLRLAQSNAASSTQCNNQGSTSWSLVFINSTTIEMRCDPANYRINTTVLENAQVDSIKGSGCLDSVEFPVTFSYLTGAGALTISPSGNLCLTNASSVIFSISNVKDSTKTKTFTVSKGGAINVQ